MLIFACICKCRCTCICMCMNIYIYRDIHVYMYICRSIHIHVYTSTYRQTMALHNAPQTLRKWQVVPGAEDQRKGSEIHVLPAQSAAGIKAPAAKSYGRVAVCLLCLKPKANWLCHAFERISTSSAVAQPGAYSSWESHHCGRCSHFPRSLVALLLQLPL